MTRDEDRSDRVLAIAQDIMSVLAGLDMREAHTALTVAIACEIIVTIDNEILWPTTTSELKRQVDAFLASKSNVEFVKASIQPLPHSGLGHA